MLFECVVVVMMWKKQYSRVSLPKRIKQEKKKKKKSEQRTVYKHTHTKGMRTYRIY